MVRQTCVYADRLLYDGIVSEDLFFLFSVSPSISSFGDLGLAKMSFDRVISMAQDQLKKLTGLSTIAFDFMRDSRYALFLAYAD